MTAEPTEDLHNNRAHWRARAEETRKKANAMGSPELRERMLQIALDYDRLAEWAGASGGSHTGDQTNA